MKYLVGKKWTDYPPSSKQYKDNYDAIDWSDSGGGGRKRKRSAKRTERIVKNQAKCLSCGDTVESKHRNDFVPCSCGDLCVDGGHDYIKRCFKSEDCYEELSEVE